MYRFGMRINPQFPQHPTQPKIPTPIVIQEQLPNLPFVESPTCLDPNVELLPKEIKEKVESMEITEPKAPTIKKKPNKSASTKNVQSKP